MLSPEAAAVKSTRCVFQSGDTVLIGAVRGGHVEIVRALLHKYADIDIRGQVRRQEEEVMSLQHSES